MFDIFIALFGILFYGSKYIKEKSDLCAADRELDDIKKTRDIFINKYTDYDMEQWALKFLLCGENYIEICNNFAKYFEFVLGDDWMEKLDIPNGYSIDSCRTSLYPNQHVYWVYHLLLASQGKIDRWCLTMGFPVGGLITQKISIKFIECIEKCLQENGHMVNLVLELTEDVTTTNISGGKIKPKEICYRKTHKLW